jgi:hypothetical protein
MTVVKRLDHALVIGVLFAACLCTPSLSFGHPAGYWTCSSGKWIAVGRPKYPAPSKLCGSKLKIPRTQFACEESGGRWGPAGIFPRPICKMPTHDGGRVCADTGECEGLCLTALTPTQRDLLRTKQTLKMVGKCAPVSPLFGCLAIVKEGFVTGLECRD